MLLVIRRSNLETPLQYATHTNGNEYFIDRQEFLWTHEGHKIPSWAETFPEDRKRKLVRMCWVDFMAEKKRHT